MQPNKDEHDVVSISNENLEKILKKIEENTKRDFIRITTKLSKERLGLTESKFGGIPYWPDITTYPRAEDGTMLTMLAQINLKDLPENDVFPNRGMLQFFILNLDDTKNYKVVYHKEVKHQDVFNPLVPTSLMPQALEAISDTGERFIVANAIWKNSRFPVIGELALEFSKEQESVNPTESRFASEYINAAEQLDIPVPKVFDLYTIQPELLERFYKPGAGHKLTGNPFFLMEEHETLDDEVLLLQIDSSCQGFGGANKRNSVEYGTSGCAWFFIKKDDLQRLDFSNVRYTWESL